MLLKDLEARREYSRKYREKRRAELLAAKKADYAANREKRLLQAAKWQRENKVAVAIRNKKWASKNKDKFAAYSKKWRQKHPDRRAAQDARRRARKTQASPPWMQEHGKEIMRFYRVSRLLSHYTGVP